MTCPEWRLGTSLRVLFWTHFVTKWRYGFFPLFYWNTTIKNLDNIIKNCIEKNAVPFKRERIKVLKSIQLNNSQEALGQLPFILDLNIVTWHNLASDLMALVMNAIHLLDATLVFYSYFSKALTQLFFSFFYLLYFQSAIIAFDLSSKDLSPLLSKHLPGFYCSTVSSSRLRMSSLGWYCDSHGK